MSARTGADRMIAPAVQLQSLGSYELVKKLGSGGMAEVFLAVQRMGAGVERTVVIKAILPHLSEDESFVRMFTREVQIAAALSHANIVQVYDVSVIDARPCIVMEFLRGRDLWFTLRRVHGEGRRLPFEATAAVGAQAATGLDHAHRKTDARGRSIGVVHRDVSPHNVFLTREGTVRIVDFGVAKSSFQQQHTQAGTLKGKISYMAPEQARGAAVDGRADQFALGIVLWEMLTGHRLFSRDDPMQTMNALFYEEIPAPSEVDPAVPAELGAIVMRMLSRDPADRYESCEAVAFAMRDWLRARGAGAEARLLAAALEAAVPASEDDEFYGFGHTAEHALPELLEEDAATRVEDSKPSGSFPSQSGVMVQARRAAPEAAPPLLEALAPPPRPAGRARLARWLGAAGFVAAVAVVTAILVSRGTVEERAAEPPAAHVAGAAEQAPEPPAAERPVEVRFEPLPEGVVLEVDGIPLEGAVLRVLPSDAVYHVRALWGGEEVWAHEAAFTEPTVVAVPELAPPEDGPQGVSEPRARRRARTAGAAPADSPRPARAPMERRGGLSIDLDYE